MYHPYFQFTDGGSTGKSRVIPSMLQKEANERLREWVEQQYILQNKKRDEAKKEQIAVKEPERKKPILIAKSFVPEFRDVPVSRVIAKPDVISIDEILAPIQEQVIALYRNMPVMAKIDPIREDDEEVLTILLLTL